MSARADEVDRQGNTDARIETTVGDAEGGSRIRMGTGLQKGDRVAQFGQEATGKISLPMFSEFARNIEQPTPGSWSAQEEDQPEPPSQAGKRTAERSPESRQQPDAGIPTSASCGEEQGEESSVDAIGLLAGSLMQKALPMLVLALAGFGYPLCCLRGLER